MIIQEPMSSSSSNLFSESSIIVLERLLHTINAYSTSFSELPALSKNIQLLLEMENNLPPLKRLDSICDILKDLGLNSYIIRKLHFEFANDVAAIKNNTPLDSQPEIYWT